MEGNQLLARASESEVRARGENSIKRFWNERWRRRSARRIRTVVRGVRETLAEAPMATGRRLGCCHLHRLGDCVVIPLVVFQSAIDESRVGGGSKGDSWKSRQPPP